jgi:hypothetical protein
MLWTPPRSAVQIEIGTDGRVHISHPDHAVESSPARATDPATSEAAAEKHRVKDVGRFGPTSYSGKLLSWYHRYAPIGLTDTEVANSVFAGHPVVGDHNRRRLPDPAVYESCRRRCSDLRKVGYIAVTDVDDSEERRMSHISPTLDEDRERCKLTPAGEEAYRRMIAEGYTR